MQLKAYMLNNPTYSEMVLEELVPKGTLYQLKVITNTVMAEEDLYQITTLSRIATAMSKRTMELCTTNVL